jgi:hypothetical protein
MGARRSLAGACPGKSGEPSDSRGGRDVHGDEPWNMENFFTPTPGNEDAHVEKVTELAAAIASAAPDRWPSRRSEPQVVRDPDRGSRSPRSGGDRIDVIGLPIRSRRSSSDQSRSTRWSERKRVCWRPCGNRSVRGNGGYCSGRVAIGSDRSPAETSRVFVLPPRDHA